MIDGDGDDDDNDDDEMIDRCHGAGLRAFTVGPELSWAISLLPDPIIEFVVTILALIFV